MTILEKKSLTNRCSEKCLLLKACQWVSYRISRLANKSICFFLCFTLISCGQSTQQITIEIPIEKNDFVVTIPATGELEAITATTISVPASVMGPQVVEWLAEENSYVTKGQVVARFDGQKFRYQSQQEQFEIDKANIGLVSQRKVLLNEKQEISSDGKLIEQELAIADRYSVDDLQVYSRNEIIDALKNKDYLKAKRSHTQWRSDSHQKKSDSQMQLLGLKKGQHDAKFDSYQSALKKLEITAPHDGLFVLQKNWKGEKTHAGDTLFPGVRLASLPDLSKLQAKIYILEAETAGVKLQQKVILRLDAYPDELIEGKLIKLDKIAKTRSRNSPVKYIEGTVSIDGDKRSYWRPGIQLSATILAADKKNVISIPSQAMHADNGEYYVDLLEGDDWLVRKIKIGIRSSAKTEVLAGLTPGDIIALFNPKRMEKKQAAQRGKIDGTR